MLKLLKNLKLKDWLLLVISIGFIVTQVWLELEIPEYTAKLTTIVQNENAVMKEVWKNGGLMLLCALGSLCASIICALLISKLASSFSKTLREMLFNKIVGFSDAEIKKYEVPSLITRTTNDVMQVQNFMAMGVQMLFKAPIMAVWAICKISATNIKWTVATLIGVAIIVTTVCILVFLCMPRFKKIQKLTDDINNVTRENITGVRVVRAFNAEKYEEEKFEKVNKNITDNHLFTAKVMGIMSPIMTLVMNGLNLAIYFIGAILINNIVLNSQEALLERITTVGNMTAFSQYALQVVMSFMALIIIFIILPRTLVSSGRINEILTTLESITFNGGSTGKSVDTAVEFKDVFFRYQDGNGEDFVLNNINFEIKKGETFAIIGATGSAKTTLINLIPRFYDVVSGEVLVCGTNVKDYEEKVLRQKIAVATQKAVLFKGTIKDNIIYGQDNGLNEEALNDAIQIASADFIGELDKGVESEVAQGGTNFSGGQKQRISIARAIYKGADIMIFDDSFSALDYKTDMLVRKAINEKLSGKTIIIVAQRIGTIKDADQILVLDEGKIVGLGKHKELLETCAEYKEIALSQLSREEL